MTLSHIIIIIKVDRVAQWQSRRPPAPQVKCSIHFSVTASNGLMAFRLMRGFYYGAMGRAEAHPDVLVLR